MGTPVYSNAMRVSEADYQKGVINTAARLPGDGSGPMGGPRPLTRELVTTFYDREAVLTSNPLLALAQIQKQETVEYYFLRFSSQNELINPHNAVHMDQVSKGSTMWRKVNKEAFSAYCDFLRSNPPRLSAYDAAKSNFVV